MERFHQAHLPVGAGHPWPPQASDRGPALPVTRAVRAEAGGSQGREATDGVSISRLLQGCGQLLVLPVWLYPHWAHLSCSRRLSKNWQ